MATWFTSDWHLGHVNIPKYTDRWERWPDVDDMNEAFIGFHNSAVAPDDEVFVLGDVCMGKIDVTLPMVGRMHGRKHLIFGNHDRLFGGEKHRVKWDERYRTVFDTIYDIAYVELGEIMVKLNHFPYTGESGLRVDDRHPEQRPVDDGMILLHGHVHSSATSIGPRQVHVGIDADWTSYGVERYHPIPESAVVARICDMMAP